MEGIRLFTNGKASVMNGKSFFLIRSILLKNIFKHLYAAIRYYLFASKASKKDNRCYRRYAHQQKFYHLLLCNMEKTLFSI
jgi:hypothetical protein